MILQLQHPDGRREEREWTVDWSRVPREICQVRLGSIGFGWGSSTPPGEHPIEWYPLSQLDCPQEGASYIRNWEETITSRPVSSTPTLPGEDTLSLSGMYLEVQRPDGRIDQVWWAVDWSRVSQDVNYVGLLEWGPSLSAQARMYPNLDDAMGKCWYGDPQRQTDPQYAGGEEVGPIIPSRCTILNWRDTLQVRPGVEAESEANQEEGGITENRQVILSADPVDGYFCKDPTTTKRWASSRPYDYTVELVEQRLRDGVYLEFQGHLQRDPECTLLAQLQDGKPQWYRLVPVEVERPEDPTGQAPGKSARPASETPLCGCMTLEEDRWNLGIWTAAQVEDHLICGRGVRFECNADGSVWRQVAERVVNPTDGETSVRWTWERSE